MSLEDAKKGLDKVIRKARIHAYKPIQIAEILYHQRMSDKEIDLEDLDSYRNISKQWRDEISMRLVGNVSTSSARYQDNLFESNAIPPNLLAELGKENLTLDGIVEAYIYHQLYLKWEAILVAYDSLGESAVEEFDLAEFLKQFTETTKLVSSIDKVYEVIVYCLLGVLIDSLDASITITFNDAKPAIRQDFSGFIEKMFGHSITQISAAIFRAGVANAADHGLDMWTNFGPVIQVKHLALTTDTATRIAEGFDGAPVIIVCKEIEQASITAIMSSTDNSVFSIITEEDLIEWYHLCQHHHKDTLGKALLERLKKEYAREFPMVAITEIRPFLKERGYTLLKLSGLWRVS